MGAAVNDTKIRARKREVHVHFQWASTGQAVQRKIFLFRFFVNYGFLTPSRLMQRDVRVVTNVEVGYDGRGGCARRAPAGTDGEIVWSWHPGAGVKLVRC
jgi:hypothetical protein